jgi:hypothetical protein
MALMSSQSQSREHECEHCAPWFVGYLLALDLTPHEDLLRTMAYRQAIVGALLTFKQAEARLEHARVEYRTQLARLREVVERVQIEGV